MYITSPSKGGSTTNLLSLLTNVTGVKYPRSKMGVEQALHHIGFLLVQSMDAETIAAREAERQALIERSRSLCPS
jgi:hypothetical protein